VTLTASAALLTVFAGLAPAVRPSVVEFQVRNPKEPASLVTICSAVVVDRTHRALVVTGEHCLVHGTDFFADRVPLEEVARQDGVVVFEATGRRREWRAMPLAPAQPALGKPVCAAGFAYSEFFAMQCGTVSGTSPDGLWMDLEVIAGQSGGPIVDRQGRLVSLVYASRVDGLNSPNGLANSPTTKQLRAAVAKARRARTKF